MRSSIEHTCAHCHAVSVVSGAQVFVPRPCPACGVVTRARDEIGGYQLHEVLARSGFGIIFLAADREGASLAVKLLQPPHAAEAEDVQFFVAEVTAVAQLNHPNCLRVFATGIDEGIPWIAMEWLAHGSLADRLAQRGRLPEAEVLSLGLQLANALGAAHAFGHIHRDVEPNNLLFADGHTVKLTDFGQAAFYQIVADDLGTVWGRTWYISPERLRDEPEEACSDIYSLGAVLFHALAGTPLHDGEQNGQEMLDRIESGDVRVEEWISPLHDKTALVLNRMLASEPSHRFQYWSEVVTQLTQAGALVARRDASLQAPEPTVVAKPIAAVAAPKPPRDSHLLGALITAAFLAATGAIGFLVWKYRAPLKPPPSRVAIASPKPATPSPRPLPLPHTSASPRPSPSPLATAAKPAATKAPSAFDWRGWKTVTWETSAASGVPQASGNVDAPSGALRVIAAGTGVGGEKDDGGFHFRTMENDWTFTAHIVAHDRAAGLSVRDSEASGSVGLSIWVKSDGSLAAAVRKAAGAKPELMVPVAAKGASWLRLNRRGTALSAEYSANAKQWKAIARFDGVPISPKPVAGFVVWSGTRDDPATAVFDRVSVSAASPPRSPQPRSGSPPSSPPARDR